MDADIGDRASMNVMPRHGWTDVAADSSHMELRVGPAHYVFYTHTAETGKCHVTSQCCGQLRNIQSLHMDVRRQYTTRCFIVSRLSLVVLRLKDDGRIRK